MCQIILSIPDEVLYDTKMSHEQVNQLSLQDKPIFLKSHVVLLFHLPGYALLILTSISTFY